MFARLIVFIVLFSVVWFVVRLLLRATDDTVRCSRCEGKGFWYDARGKEKCDWCKGSGRLPKQ